MLNWTERISSAQGSARGRLADFNIIATPNPAILIIRYDWRNNSVLFVHNLDERPQGNILFGRTSRQVRPLLANLLSEDHSRAGTRGRDSQDCRSSCKLNRRTGSAFYPPHANSAETRFRSPWPARAGSSKACNKA
jgi:hypothetical protein